MWMTGINIRNQAAQVAVHRQFFAHFVRKNL